MEAEAVDRPWDALSAEEKVARAEDVLSILERRGSALVQSRCLRCSLRSAPEKRCRVCVATRAIGADLLRLHEWAVDGVVG